MIRLITAVLLIVPSTLYYGARIMWAAWRKAPPDAPIFEHGPRDWCKSILWSAGAKVVLEGADAIDPGRPQILVANHTSWFDVAALAAYVPGIYRFVAKQELTTVPVFGPAWQACGHIAIDRGSRQKAIQSMARARKKLEEERPTVIMFPEGTRSLTGELKAFKKGAFLLALQTGVEIVPAAILGSYEIMPKGRWRIYSGTITVRFGKPIQVDGMTVDDRDALMGQVRSAILSLQGQTEADEQKTT